jgi:curved DNA-binding protein CbpA
VTADDDLYAVLGISRDADQAAVRAAYRRLAQLHHPDRGADSAERMVAINLAYAVLSKPERRRRYDASLDVPQEHLWTDESLAEHADDWRQMFEEERNLWEQLLKTHPSASAEAALAQTRQAQLDLENALRARAGLPPLSPSAFEEERALVQARTPRAPVGCLLVLFHLFAALGD